MGPEIAVGVFLIVLVTALLAMGWHIRHVYGKVRADEVEQETRAQQTFRETRDTLHQVSGEFYHELELLRAGRARRDGEP